MEVDLVSSLTEIERRGIFEIDLLAKLEVDMEVGFPVCMALFCNQILHRHFA